MQTKTDKIIEITDNSRDYLQAIYLDYLNNFASFMAFAEYYDLPQADVVYLLLIAKQVHNERTSHRNQ